jgi:hypothetical protein
MGAKTAAPWFPSGEVDLGVGGAALRQRTGWRLSRMPPAAGP